MFVCVGNAGNLIENAGRLDGWCVVTLTDTNQVSMWKRNTAADGMCLRALRHKGHLGEQASLGQRSWSRILGQLRRRFIRVSCLPGPARSEASVQGTRRPGYFWSEEMQACTFWRRRGQAGCRGCLLAHEAVSIIAYRARACRTAVANLTVEPTAFIYRMSAAGETCFAVALKMQKSPNGNSSRIVSHRIGAELRE